MRDDALKKVYLCQTLGHEDIRMKGSCGAYAPEPLRPLTSAARARAEGSCGKRKRLPGSVVARRLISTRRSRFVP